MIIKRLLAAIENARHTGSIKLQPLTLPKEEALPDDASWQTCHHQYEDGLHDTWCAKIGQARMQIHQLPITKCPAKWMLVGLHKSCHDHDNILMLSITICPAEEMLFVGLASPQEEPDASYV